MKKLITGICGFFIACLFLTILSVETFAQSSDRVWEQGTIWVVSQVETKPGNFNNYVSDLSNVWRRYLEEQKKDGVVSSYKILNVAFTRDGEPDLILLVEYPDWAAFDRGQEYFEELATRMQGSMENARQANIKREDLRILRGSLVAQEISFSN